MSASWDNSQNWLSVDVSSVKSTATFVRQALSALPPEVTWHSTTSWGDLSYVQQWSWWSWWRWTRRLSSPLTSSPLTSDISSRVRPAVVRRVRATSVDKQRHHRHLRPVVMHYVDRSTLQRVTTPCLIVTTKLDRNVEISTSRSRRSRISPSRTTRWPRRWL